MYKKFTLQNVSCYKKITVNTCMIAKTETLKVIQFRQLLCIHIGLVIQI